VIGPDDEIKLPALSSMVDWEAEFAVVIGKPGKNISVETAFEHVAGYTIMNDLSARDQGKRDDWPRFGVDWFGHKNFDTSAPMGPWITPADQIADPYECRMKLWVNQDEMQNEVISDLIFDIAEQIEWVSRRFNLLPGDVFSTGTPSGVGRPRGIFLKPGDTVRITVDGIGELTNPVVQGD
jgi:2-keto-4-pentenoate hydratase/2-oxohepta-3-ene-1,7-dioic acid hydratase in catechol pathway